MFTKRAKQKNHTLKIKINTRNIGLHCVFYAIEITCTNIKITLTMRNFPHYPRSNHTKDDYQTSKIFSYINMFCSTDV